MNATRDATALARRLFRLRNGTDLAHVILEDLLVAWYVPLRSTSTSAARYIATTSSERGKVIEGRLPYMYGYEVR